MRSSSTAKRKPSGAAEPKVAAKLLAWYDDNARSLPWRRPPGRAAPIDPYTVWISEIMLQQTTVEAVKPRFGRFLARFPSIEALASAPLEDVLAEWAGLGYYARARKLHACAVALAQTAGGRFPRDLNALEALPGIGPYTAGAIAAIAFGRPVAVIDGNVERVIARLFAIETPLPAAKKLIRERTEALVPEARPGDFAQALMDLGATICAPRRPLCARCPLGDVCSARAKGLAATLPLKPAKQERPLRHGTAFVVRDGAGALLVRRRPMTGLLAGMLEVPSTPWAEHRLSREEALRHAPLRAPWRLLAGRVGHTFTHFHLELDVLSARSETSVGGVWLKPHEIDGAALPSVMRKVIAHAEAAGAPAPRVMRRSARP